MGLTPFEVPPELRGRLGALGQAGSGLTALKPSQQALSTLYQPIGNQYTAPPGAQTGLGNLYTQGAQASQFGNKYTQMQAQQQGGAMGQAGGQVANVGGAWAALDQHNNEIASVAQAYGAPANLLKAMINRESSGNWGRDNRVTSQYRGERMLPFVGIFESTAKSWGLDFDAMIGNKQAQIAGMATILNGLAQQYGGYENAAKVYFGGPQALTPGGFTDELGMNSNDYGAIAVQDWKWLDQQSGYSGGYGDGGVGTGIVTTALQFTGVPYVWGSLPQTGDDPWQTGWDCSGFIDYLDNTYGKNELPAGSHFQYQDTVKKGLLIQDPNQLRSGDLVFFDTGATGGGGSYLNNASHVGMYIGNGQFIQAANPGAGTIVSNLSDYIQQYGFLGGRKMGWSGGGSLQQTNQPAFSSLIQKYLLAA
jgi:cell wall-associated NlpC family hydrolase